MIDAARENNVTVTVFQQSRLAPYFIKMREVIESGVLGDIFEIRVSFSGFSRRYDWQTVQSYNAGSMRNTVRTRLTRYCICSISTICRGVREARKL